jgi:hypothetical protein
MKYKTFRSLALTLSLTGLCAPIFAYKMVTAEPNATVPGATGTPSVMFRAAEARLSANGYDPAAGVLLRGAEMYTKSIFNLPSLHFQRAATERVLSGPQRGDVLIAEWGVQESFGKGTVVLTDTPYYSYYELRLSECKIESRADLAAFINALLGWREDHPSVPAPNRERIQVGPFPPSELRVSPNFPATHSFSGSAFSASPNFFVADFEFVGVIEGGEWLLDFGIGKSGSEKFLGVPPWIPERFPPLAELVKPWSFGEVRRELGAPVKPFELTPAFTYNRDSILIAELVRRGLTEDQVIDLLTDVDKTPDAYRLRLASLTGAFEVSGKRSFAQIFFEPALQTYEQIGPMADQSVTSLFGQASLHCSATLEARAAGVLRKGTFIAGPLDYLQKCSSSRGTITMLENMSLPTQALERTKALAVTQIRFRVEHPANPTPSRIGVAPR